MGLVGCKLYPKLGYQCFKRVDRLGRQSGELDEGCLFEGCGKNLTEDIVVRRVRLSWDTYTSTCSSGSIDPSYLSMSGHFQLAGSSVAIISCVNGCRLDGLRSVLCDTSPQPSPRPSCREPSSSIGSSRWVLSHPSLY